jgi:hypothetical protein
MFGLSFTALFLEMMVIKMLIRIRKHTVEIVANQGAKFSEIPAIPAKVADAHPASHVVP